MKYTQWQIEDRSPYLLDNERLASYAPQMYILIDSLVTRGLLDGIALKDAQAILNAINKP